MHKNSLIMVQWRNAVTKTVAPASLSKQEGPMISPAQKPHQTVTHC